MCLTSRLLGKSACGCPRASANSLHRTCRATEITFLVASSSVVIITSSGLLLHVYITDCLHLTIPIFFFSPLYPRSCLFLVVDWVHWCVAHEFVVCHADDCSEVAAATRPAPATSVATWSALRFNIASRSSGGPLSPFLLYDCARKKKKITAFATDAHDNHDNHDPFPSHSELHTLRRALSARLRPLQCPYKTLEISGGRQAARRRSSPAPAPPTYLSLQQERPHT
jgi:hypothetical protein